jgi:hypothetical protein
MLRIIPAKSITQEHNLPVKRTETDPLIAGKDRSEPIGLPRPIADQCRVPGSIYPRSR